MAEGSISRVAVTRWRGRQLRWGGKTYVMGIINLSPDSFSGDGLGEDPEAALAQARRFAAEGADLIDIGGESTRPGSTPVSAEVELHRVMPALKKLAEEIDLPLSIDTYKGKVARAALEAGATMLNDVWGLKYDPTLAHLAAEYEVPIVLMHNQKGTEYQDLVPDILRSLRESIDIALAAGVPRERIIIDPGLGFGKTPEQNLEVVRRLEEFQALGQPILLGPSRKSMIGYVLGLPADQRVEGTAAVVALAIAKGVDIVRVHDVKEMVRVCRMADAIVRRGG